VDVALRQAALIPGMDWCSNLAGPDMCWYWKPFLPGFLAAETGWLGPYLNLLPIATIILFIVQQKMFMPPATDDQTRMQQQMMQYMMVFMGVLFFKVASGLCVYFIASSLWGLAERKLLPPVGKPDPNAPPRKPWRARLKTWLARWLGKMEFVREPVKRIIAEGQRKDRQRKG
jgi:YidC/Oxa1 family membrane protein insertase